MVKIRLGSGLVTVPVAILSIERSIKIVRKVLKHVGRITLCGFGSNSGI